jgi:HlyD family secretion protein
VNNARSLLVGVVLLAGLVSGCGLIRGETGPLATVHRGEVVKSATAVGSVGSGPSAFVQFDQPEAKIIQPGTQAVLAFSGVPGLQLTGVVTQVNPQHSAIAQKMIYRVGIKIPVEDARLKPGDWVRATVSVLRLPNVLVVPNAAVRAEKATTYVLTEDGRKLAFTPGVVGDDLTEVRSGLDDGTQVRLKQ